MAGVQQLKAWFTTITSVLRKDGTIGGVRFLTTDKPSQQTLENLMESVTFKKETGDRAKTYTGSTDLGTQQGIVTLATDAQAKSNATQLSTQSLVAIPSQLPTVNSTTNDLTVSTIPTDGAVTSTQTLFNIVPDSTTTRNNFLVNLTTAGVKFLLRRILPAGGTTSQVIRKTSNTDFDYTWNTLDRNTDLTSTLNIVNGGSGQTTPNTALNAFLPTQTGNSGKALTTDGSNTSWVSPLANIGTVPINQGGTGQTTANAALNALLPTQTSNSGKFLETNGTNTSWVAISTLFSSIFDRQRIAVTTALNTTVPSGVSGVVLEIARRTTANDGITRNYIVHATVDLNSLTTAPEAYIGIYAGSTTIGTASVIHAFHFNPSSTNGASTTVSVNTYIPSVSPNTIIYLGTYILGSTNQYNLQTYELIIDGTPL